MAAGKKYNYSAFKTDDYSIINNQYWTYIDIRCGFVLSYSEKFGALYPVTTTVDTYVYRGLLQNSNIGMTSATSVFQSVVGFVLVVTVNKIIKKVSPGDEMF